MRVRRLAAWAALPLAVTLGLAACGKGGDGGSGGSDPNGAVRHRDRRAAAPGPDQHQRDERLAGARRRCSARWSTSTRQNKPFEVAAESITSTDNKVWTIKLKDGYTFHNGEKVTADNYINAWNYGAYGPNGQDNNYFFEQDRGLRGPATRPTTTATPDSAKTLTGLKKVDDLTFTVTLSEPFSEFKSMLGYTAFYPLPKAAFAAPGVLAEGLTSRRRSATARSR